MLGFEIGQRESGFYSERTESQTDRQNHRTIQYLISIYVSVNLCNQAIRELTENFRQFVKCLF